MGLQLLRRARLRLRETFREPSHQLSRPHCTPFRPLLSLRRQTRKFPINYSFLPMHKQYDRSGGDHLRAFEYISNATGDVTGTFRPHSDATGDHRPTTVVPPETNSESKVSEQLLLPPHAQTIRPERRRSPPGLRIHQY
jgi:hypothetical protein